MILSVFSSGNLLYVLGEDCLPDFPVGGQIEEDMLKINVDSYIFSWGIFFKFAG